MIEKKNKTILGIDPGSNFMGFGIIEYNKQNLKLIFYDVLIISKNDNQFKKLKVIFDYCINIIEKYNPDEISLESTFFGKNVQSMIKLGRAQGIAISAGIYKNIPIFEYAPLKIKKALTGRGSSSKEQVAKMVMRFLNTEIKYKYIDCMDALAVAICHSMQNNLLLERSYSSWKDFLNKKNINTK